MIHLEDGLFGRWKPVFLSRAAGCNGRHVTGAIHQDDDDPDALLVGKDPLVDDVADLLTAGTGSFIEADAGGPGAWLDGYPGRDQRHECQPSETSLVHRHRPSFSIPASSSGLKRAGSSIIRKWPTPDIMTTLTP